MLLLLLLLLLQLLVQGLLLTDTAWTYTRRLLLLSLLHLLL